MGRNPRGIRLYRKSRPTAALRVVFRDHPFGYIVVNCEICDEVVRD